MQYQLVNNIVRYLTDNPGKVWISDSETTAMVYDHNSEAVIILQGDFTGGYKSIMKELDRVYNNTLN